MPGQTRQTQAPAPEQVQASGPSETTPAESNSQKQEEVRGKKGTQTGLEQYQSTLGKWLGGELYKALAPNLTFEAMQGFANQGLTAAIDAGAGELGKLDGLDAKQMEAFGKALTTEYDKLAGEVLDSELGHKITGGLASWVDAHPGIIVSVALLAAAGAILADMDIPTIKQKFKIADGLTANLEADLGSLRNIALEQVKAGLEYKSGPLVAAINMKRDENGELSGTANAEVSGETGSIKADVEYGGDTIKAYGVHGVLNVGEDTKVSGDLEQKADKDPTIQGKIVRQDGGVTDIDEVKYDWNTGVATFTDTQILKLAESEASLSRTMGSDGSGAANFGLKHDFGDGLTGNMGYGYKTTPGEGGSTTESNALNMGLDYKHNGLNLGLKGNLDDQGNSGLSGTYSQTLADQWKLNASAGFEDKSDKDALGTFGAGLQYGDSKSRLNFGLDTKLNTDGLGHVGGNFGYRPSDNFSLTGSGKYEFGEQDKYNLAADMKWKGDAGHRFELGGSYANGEAPNSEKLKLDALGQYQLNPNWAVQSTLNYTRDQAGNNFAAGLNAQRKLDQNWSVTGGTDVMFGDQDPTARFKLGTQFQKWNVQGFVDTKGQFGLMLGVPF